MAMIPTSTPVPLSLTPDESDVFTLPDIPDDSHPSINLLLRLFTIRPFNRPSLMKTLSQMWTSQCRFPVVVSEHSEGSFLVTFGCEGDKKRILDGQPWHFAQSLTVFASPDHSFPLTADLLHYIPFWVQVYGIPFRCKSYDLAKLIASGLGDLIQVDEDTIKEGTGPYLRGRFLLDVNKPLRRGINIRFLKMGREFTKWLDFKYERLPDFCFYCGRLDHTRRFCQSYLQKCDENPVPPPSPYTILLRGKEKSMDKSGPFDYPHPPAFSISELPQQPFPLNQGMSNPFLAQSYTFTGLLNSTIKPSSFLGSPVNSSVLMIPTPVNPNLSTQGTSSFPEYITHMHYGSVPSHMTIAPTDSTIVSDHSDIQHPEVIRAARSLADAIPSLDLGTHMEKQTATPDPNVKGKGLACASGVKRPTFHSHHVQIGGSLRSQLKRARSGDADSVPPSTTPTEQAGVAGHTRPEK
uniref:Zinc knuckle CX2CX4HX4C domain-containing protein n=1 Tax=Cannabis sativa TaxID=3483 RepID=A0A803PY77_CANSA